MVTCRRAKVIRNEGRWSRVEVHRSTMCDGCNMEHDACAAGLEGERTTTALAENLAGANEGDLVELELDEGVMLWGTVLIYLTPLAGMLLAILGGLYLRSRLGWRIDENLLAAIAGVIGLLAGLAVVRVISQRSRYFSRGRPRISRVVSRAEEATVEVAPRHSPAR